MNRPLPVAADVRKRIPFRISDFGSRISPSASSRRPLRRALVLSLGLVSVVGSALGATPAPSIDRLIDFQQYRFGVPPSEFDYDGAEPSRAASVTGRPAWRTYVDLSAPSPKMVLIRSAAQDRAEQYPIAVLRDVSAENVTLAVSFKLLSGATSRSAGLLWRAQGTNSYCSVLVSALHREIRLMKLEAGMAAELAKATATFDEKDWSSLEVSVQGERVTVWLNERRVLEARDAASSEPGRADLPVGPDAQQRVPTGFMAPIRELGNKATPSKPGGVGLITTTDTVALFDDFYVQNGPGRVARRKRPALALSPAAVMHVTQVLTTLADFKTPCRSFRPGGQVRWRVQVADEHQKPSPAAIVECELVNPEGRVVDRDKAMTGTDGAALFARALAKDAIPGAYTVRVKVITRTDMPEAVYSPRENLKSDATFEVRP